jgi:hypothetical protein
MQSRLAHVLTLLLVSVLASGCGAGERRGAVGDGPTKRVSGHGLSIAVPAGWDAEVVRPDPPGALTLRAANSPLPQASDVGQRAQQEMNADEILITLSHYGRTRDGSNAQRASVPLAIDRADFTSFEGFRRPVATTSFVIDEGAFQVWVVFGSETPSDELLAEANRVLETFAVEPRPLALDGLSIELPVGWDGFAKRLEVDERPALYAANVPWPDVGQNFELAPVREQFEQLPADGVVVSAVFGPRGADPG